jgi:putative thioredoxin
MTSSSFSRHGAVDLSQLAQRAKQSAPAQPAAAASPSGPGQVAGGGTGSYVVEATEQTFEAEVIRRSVKHPVVVELYSPRVPTGQQLSDALAELAAEAAGRFLLVRVNVDQAPGIVQALGLQAVPTVIAVIGGQVAPLFQGVLDKQQAGAYVDQLLKAAVANGIVGRAEPVAPGATAEPVAEDVQAADPRFAAADEALARGDFTAAVAEFDKLVQANPNDADAKAGRAQAGLLARAAVLDPRSTLARAAASSDLVDQLAAADVEMITGQAEAAFTRLIGVIARSPGEDRNTARVRLLELFETLGNGDPRVLKARRDLMAALF